MKRRKEHYLPETYLKGWWIGRREVYGMKCLDSCCKNIFDIIESSKCAYFLNLNHQDSFSDKTFFLNESVFENFKIQEQDFTFYPITEKMAILFFSKSIKLADNYINDYLIDYFNFRSIVYSKEFVIFPSEYDDQLKFEKYFNFLYKKFPGINLNQNARDLSQNNFLNKKINFLSDILKKGRDEK